MQRIVVAGAGVFGTAMAERLSWNPDNEVTVHSIVPEVVSEMNASHTNGRYVPGKLLNPGIRATGDNAVFDGRDVIFLAVPAEFILSFSEGIRPNVSNNPLVINLAKGMTQNGAFITQDIPFERTCSLKGPSFAVEVINGMPTALTFGGEENDFVFVRDTVFAHTGITLDYCADVRAVELCSVLKNMYAIAIGIFSGRYASQNVDFMVYTKAVREMRSLLKLFKCDPESIFNYCGIGDLGLTALNDLSRNRTFGLLLGKGFALKEEKNAATIVEGKRTIELMYKEVSSLGEVADFPLLSALYDFIYNKKPLTDFIRAVLPH